jgi:hypothetical protein
LNTTDGSTITGDGLNETPSAVPLSPDLHSGRWEHKPYDVRRVGAKRRDDLPAVRVGDDDCRAALTGENVREPRHVVGERRLGELRGGDVEPAGLQRSITSHQDDPSAQAPCTSTMFGFFSGVMERSLVSRP